MQLRERTIRSIRITLLGTLSGAALQMLILVILARLLLPRDYGAYAGALIIIQPLQAGLLSTTERAIVIQGDASAENVSSVQGIMFWLMAILAILIGVSGLLAARWFHNPTAATLAACTPILPVAALAMAARAQLRRSMAFRKLVVTDFIAQFLGAGCIAILCAMMGLGPFSLVLGAFAQISIQALGYRWGAIRAVRMGTNFAEARPTLKTAYFVGKISILEILQGQIPPTFIGTILGTTPLGLYSRSSSLVQLPIELLVTSISRVIYSSFSSVREEKEKFIAAFYQLLEVITVIVFPIAAGMAIAAPQLVGAILGNRWIEAEPLIAWFTVGCALNMTGTIFATVIESALHLNARFYGQLFIIFVGILSFALLTNHGLIDACIAFTITWSLCFVVQMVMARNLLHLEFSQLLRSMTPGLIGAVAVGSYIFAVQTALPALIPTALLLIEVAGSGAILIVVVAVLFPRLFRELLNYSGLKQLVSG